jgi:hypothetical protein
MKNIIFLLVLILVACTSKTAKQDKTSNEMAQKGKEITTFQFKESENTATFVCEHVFKRENPIHYVSHDAEDSSWQFLCGSEGHDVSKVKVISLKQVTEIDPSINELYEMPLGYGAERETTKNKWIPFKL